MYIFVEQTKMNNELVLYDTGEWWNADPEDVIAQALQTGGGPNVSDAYTINGFPGPLYNCSAKGKLFYKSLHMTN